MDEGRKGNGPILLARPRRLDRRAALAILREVGGDRQNMLDLRTLLARELHRSAIHRMRDETVLERLADLLALGSLTLAMLHRPEATVPLHAEESEAGESAAGESAAADQPMEDEKTWIEFQVVWDDSDEPLPSISLFVLLPSGEEKELTTDKKGKIRLDNADAGSYGVRSDFAQAKRTDTLVFLGIGGAHGDPSGDASEKKKDEGNKNYRIAQVEKHKVRTGETLESLAKKVGMTWKDLATFNWGTDDPKEINGFLRHDVGCTKKAADGNFMFDDTDDPGIILLPAPWKEMGVAAGNGHVIRVGVTVRGKPWIFSL